MGKVDLIQFNFDKIVGTYSAFSDDVIDSIVHEFISYFKSSNTNSISFLGDDLHKKEFVKNLRQLSK